LCNKGHKKKETRNFTDPELNGHYLQRQAATLNPAILIHRLEAAWDSARQRSIRPWHGHGGLLRTCCLLQLKLQHLSQQNIHALLTSLARTWKYHSVILCLPHVCCQLPQWTLAAPLPTKCKQRLRRYSSPGNSNLHVPSDSPGLDSRSITFSKGSDRRHIWHLCPLKKPNGVLASCPSCKAWNSQRNMFRPKPKHMHNLWGSHVFELHSITTWSQNLTIRTPYSECATADMCEPSTERSDQDRSACTKTLLAYLMNGHLLQANMCVDLVFC